MRGFEVFYQKAPLPTPGSLALDDDSTVSILEYQVGKAVLFKFGVCPRMLARGDTPTVAWRIRLYEVLDRQLEEKAGTVD